MKLAKKNKYKNRLLSSVLLSILILIIVAVFSVLLMIGSDTISAIDHAKEAAYQTNERFQILIDSSFRQMRIAANNIGFDAEKDMQTLQQLVSDGNFVDAALVSNGMRMDMNGDKHTEQKAASYAKYTVDGVDVRLVGGKDSVELWYPVTKTIELAAELDIQLLKDVLGSAYDQECAYALYNIATGSYMINATPFTEGGYFDALLMLNYKGSTEALMESNEAQTYITRPLLDESAFFIAQQRSPIPSWGISLLIPENHLMDNQSQPKPLVMLLVFSIVALLACIVYLGVSIHRMILCERNLYIQHVHLDDLLVQQAAEASKSTICLYNRRGNTISNLHDGLNICDGSSISDLYQLADAFGLDAADADRLEELTRDLPAGKHTQMVCVADKADDEMLLLFSMNSIQEDNDLLVLTVRDCTLEHQNQNRVIDEQNFRRMMINKAASIWQINVSRNRWRLTDTMQGHSAAMMGIRNKNWRDYDSDLHGCVREFIQPQDFDSYADLLSRSALNEAYLAGKHELVLDYKTRSSGKREAEWHRQIVHLFADTNSGHIMANLYVLNINAEKNAAIEREERKRILQQSLTALGSIYYGLYYIDLDHGMCYTAKSQGGELVTQLSSAFKTTFDKYIDHAVHPDDREAFRKLLDSYYIRKNITEESHLARLEYRRLVGEEYQWSAAVVQAARFENGTIREVIIALRDIEQEKKTGNVWI